MRKACVVIIVLSSMSILGLLMCGNNNSNCVLLCQRECVSNQETGSDGNPTNINEEPDITFGHIVTIEMGDKEAGEPAEESEQDYYYSVLDKFHRKMYEAIRTQILHTNDMEYHVGIEIPTELYSDFCEDYTFIFECVMRDHPEYYMHEEHSEWSVLYQNYGIGSKEDTCMLYLYQCFELPDYEEELETLEAAADDFLADLDRNGTEYDIALQIHDKLIDLVTYNNADVIKEGVNYKQTVYGALIGTVNGANQCNCEGYADAFCYLIKKCGICCAEVSGGVGDGQTYEEAYEKAISYEGRHTWVIARLDGKWYEIDPTVDDYEVEDYKEEYREAMLTDENFLYNINHYFWAKTTEEMQDRQVDESVYFTFHGEVGTVVPKHYVYVRADDPASYYYDKIVEFRRMAELLPVAQ